MELAPESQLWSVWVVRGILMISTLCQIILTLFGSKRHRIKNRGARLFLWLAYMGANWAGAYLLGSMSTLTRFYEDTTSEGTLRLFSFWAPFILFHFAGPDTITAYSLEDNELWLRSCPVMFGNVGGATYILLRYWSNDFLGYFSILILFIGIVKYTERIFSLRSKSKQHLQGHIYILHKRDFETFLAHRDDLSKTFLCKAYLLHSAFAYQFGNLVVPSRLKKEKRGFLERMRAEEALRLVQTQLNLVYQVFYTKATVFCSVKGILVRYICFISLVATLAIFLSVIVPRSSYQTIDIAITCILLTGAIFVEVCSYIILFSSDWRKLWLKCLKWSCFDSEDSSHRHSCESECTRNSISQRLLEDSSHCDSRESKRTRNSLFQGCIRVWSRQISVSEFFCLTMTRHPGLEIDPKNWSWSESMGQYNLISSCFKKASINHCFGVGRLLNDDLEKQLNVSWEEVKPDLQRFIVRHVMHGDHINKKESWNDRYRRVLGNWGLDWRNCFLDDKCDCFPEEGDPRFPEEGDPREREQPTAHTEISEFGNCILYWHIATDICYHNHKIATKLNAETEELRGICRRLSDYILYLYVLCPSMISRGKSETVYPRICNNLLDVIERRSELRDKEEIHKNLIRWEKKYRPKFRNYSYLGYGCQMAKFFQKGEWHNDDVWRMISEVWGEILGYAAIHCEWNEHIQQLGGGGELLTYVRFLILLYSL